MSTFRKQLNVLFNCPIAEAVFNLVDRVVDFIEIICTTLRTVYK